MNKGEPQLQIGKVDDLECPDCGAPMELRDSRYGLFYGCTRFPECRGTHGATADGSPKGIPADAATREARMRAHDVFDRIWQQAPLHYDVQETGEERDKVFAKIRGVARSRCYRWLEQAMGWEEGAQSHMGSMDAEQCREVIRLCTGATYPKIRSWYKRYKEARDA